jgi:uncharacterized membrane protein required for colicin V production
VKVDLALAAAVLLFGVFGWRSGAIEEVSDWIAMAVGYAASGMFLGRLGSYVAARTNVPIGAAKVAVSGALFSIASLVAAALLRYVSSRLMDRSEHRPLDHACGFVLGSGKGLFLAYAALSAVIVFQPFIEKARGPLPGDFRNSAAAGFARGHNLFKLVNIPVIYRLQKLAAAEQDPMKQDPKLQKLLKDPQLRAALQDEREAIQNGDWGALRADPRLAALLDVLGGDQ